MMAKVKNGSPESQTLIAWSLDPETICDPSGEKATEVMMLLCALCSLLSSSVAEQEGKRRQFWPREARFVQCGCYT